MSSLNQPYNNSGPSCFGLCNNTNNNEGGRTAGINNNPRSKSSHHQQQMIPQQDGLLFSLTSDDEQKKQEVEALLSQALNGLTFEERQEQQEVLHGVDNRIAEDPTLTEAALKVLDNHLMSSKHGTKYEVAESMDPDYVSARDFRLMFLRTDRYDAKAAANRILRFFDMKHDLFGEDKLAKDITMEDLDQDDIACLKTGSLQPAGIDLSGRLVFSQFPGLRKFKKLENELRAQYYITMSVVKSETTLIRGCVWIIYAIGDEFKDSSGGRGYAECAGLQMTIPPYKASIHCTFDRLHDYLVQNLAIKVMPMKMRARMKLHYGSHTECQYQLSTFGILPGLLPLTPSTSEMNLERHLEWVQSRYSAEGLLDSSPMETESSLNSNSSSTTPNPNDVLSGGNTRSNNMGNQRLVALVREYSQSYGDAKTDRLKRQVVSEIVDKIHDSGGRFLKQQQVVQQEGSNNNTVVVVWEEMTPHEVRKKIMQAFRNLRRRLDASKQKVVVGNLIDGQPRPHDVIFGRVQNPGSELLQRLIKEHSEEYESLDRGMKMRLVETIIQRIQCVGGRFLQPAATEDHNGRWREIPNEAARERISKYFRNNRRVWKTSK
mmetsp:Transcript_16058/g.39331  ORF Transcript_16058/g.39331 Transcript_16058/m.39331 type:complete len:603 (+) Transcript_16058:198-2006(+)